MYTYDKIFEAIVLKIQKDVENSWYLVNSLRNRVKKGPDSPTTETSSKTDANQKVVEQERFNRKFQMKMAVS